MPIVNDTSDSHLKNATMPANAFEARFSQGSREHTTQEGKNAGSAANLHEQRVTQEQGTH
jgi:hypothetical protein